MQGGNILHMEGAKGESCMPMIDPHVHLRDWEQSDKETILHGMSVARKAGFTHLFDMPNTSPAITSRDVVISRLADASDAARKVKGMHYHLYGGLTSDLEQVREMVGVYNELFPLVVGLKLFAGHSTGNMGILSEDLQRSIFDVLVSAGYEGVLAVHAEKESLLNPGFYENGRWETHSKARPVDAEIESVRDMISFAIESGFKGTLHIAHVSTMGAIELIKENRNNIKITTGATPHHALYSVKESAIHDRYLKMNPPLRDEKDRNAVFQSLLDGTIDWVESDHAPHTLKDKEEGASGIPGFSGMLLLANELRKAGCSEARLSDLFGGNVIKTFGLEKDDISVPKDLKRRFISIEDEYPIKPFTW